MKSFHGHFGVVVRAFSYMLSLGKNGLLDVSQSMAYGDANISRIQQANSANEELAGLEGDYIVQRFVFGSGADSVPSFDELPGPAGETRLGESLLQVLHLARSTPLGAVVLISDGADNGAGLDVEMLGEITSFGVPVHTIGVGREVIPEDLELMDVSVPAKVLPGSRLAAQVSIRHDAAGDARVKVYEDGNFLAIWTQFGRPSGIFFDQYDRIYVADSESDNVQNPGWEMGIRIGDAKTGWVHAFVLYPWGDPNVIAGNGAEFVAVDSAGNLYAGEPKPRNLQKYVRVRP